jgi:phosphoribosylanthranilate isomerase
VRVKICGITNIEDAMLCSNSGADALGFIFYEKSKRYIKPEDAAGIISELPALFMKVGVFVNEDADKVNDIAKFSGLNIIQLHGDEDREYIEKITLPVIKTFRVDEAFDYGILNDYTHCHWLLDTYSSDGYGGTGKTFNWSSIPTAIRNRIILAGGIGVNNIIEIFSSVKPAAVDLSSSLESFPGKKDKNKVTEFMNMVKKLRDK